MRSSTLPGGGTERCRVLDQLKILQARISKHGGKGGQSSVLIILRVEQEKLGLRQIHVGETEIELGLQLAPEQRSYLIDNCLPGAHGLLRHGQHRVRLQRVIERLVHCKKNLLSGGQGILVLGLGGIIGAGGEVRGASEVSNQLTYCDAGGSSLINDGVIKSTRGDAAVIDRINAGQISRRGWPEVGAHLPCDLLRRQCCKSSY